MDYKNLYDQEMKAERLQKIKNAVEEVEFVDEVIPELITALEVCKNNLSLAIDRGITTQKALESSDEKLVNAQAELAIMTKQFEDAARIATEAQAENKAIEKHIAEHGV